MRDADFCAEALREAPEKGKPELFNTDQGSQFTSESFTQLQGQHDVYLRDDWWSVKKLATASTVRCTSSSVWPRTGKPGQALRAGRRCRG